MADLLGRLAAVTQSGNGWTARCPAHEDRHNSLSISHQEGRWLLKCHAGCTWQDVLAALHLDASTLFDEDRGGGGLSIPLNNRATAQPSTQTTPTSKGLALEEYAAAKGLSVEFLQSCGVSEFTYEHKPALRIPYLGSGGEELSVRFRIALDGDRFRWKSKSKPCLYGLHRLAEARDAGSVVIVEGESDCHTLWFHGTPAVGVPGATNWREERDAPQLDGIETIYVVVERTAGATPFENGSPNQPSGIACGCSAFRPRIHPGCICNAR